MNIEERFNQAIEDALRYTIWAQVFVRDSLKDYRMWQDKYNEGNNGSLGLLKRVLETQRIHRDAQDLLTTAVKYLEAVREMQKNHATIQSYKPGLIAGTPITWMIPQFVQYKPDGSLYAEPTNERE